METSVASGQASLSGTLSWIPFSNPLQECMGADSFRERAEKVATPWWGCSLHVGATLSQRGCTRQRQTKSIKLPRMAFDEADHSWRHNTGQIRFRLFSHGWARIQWWLASQKSCIDSCTNLNCKPDQWHSHFSPQTYLWMIVWWHTFRDILHALLHRCPKSRRTAHGLVRFIEQRSLDLVCI